jgi:hypothetical protein
LPRPSKPFMESSLRICWPNFVAFTQMSGTIHEATAFWRGTSMKSKSLAQRIAEVLEHVDENELRQLNQLRIQIAQLPRYDGRDPNTYVFLRQALHLRYMFGELLLKIKPDESRGPSYGSLAIVLGLTCKTTDAELARHRDLAALYPRKTFLDEFCRLRLSWMEIVDLGVKPAKRARATGRWPRSYAESHKGRGESPAATGRPLKQRRQRTKSEEAEVRRLLKRAHVGTRRTHRTAGKKGGSRR